MFGECGRKPWRGDTPHARESLTMSKIKNYRDFWFPYKNCRGGQIPCEHYSALPWFLVTVQKLLCGDQLPCNNNYRVLPWRRATVQSIPWWPITVHQLLCNNTVVAVYRGKRYRDEKSLPRKALEITRHNWYLYIIHTETDVLFCKICLVLFCGSFLVHKMVTRTQMFVMMDSN